MVSRTLKDDVRKLLRERLDAYGFTTAPILRESFVDHLAPAICEEIEHRLQMDRVDRGLLPYDEE